MLVQTAGTLSHEKPFWQSIDTHTHAHKLSSWESKTGSFPLQNHQLNSGGWEQHEPAGVLTTPLHHSFIFGMNTLVGSRLDVAQFYFGLNVPKETVFMAAKVHTGLQLNPSGILQLDNRI